MNVHLYPLFDDTKKLCVRFDLLVMLPVEDWFQLFDLAVKNGQSLPAYIVGLLKAHVQEVRMKVQEPG